MADNRGYTQSTVMPQDLKNALFAFAKERGLTPSAAVRMILTERLMKTPTTAKS